MSCSTSAGAIPLGAVMTSSEDAETLSSAFTALVDVLPDYAFFGRGRTVGPLMILTDDSASEKKHSRQPGQKQFYICVCFIFSKVCGVGYGALGLVCQQMIESLVCY